MTQLVPIDDSPLATSSLLERTLSELVSGIAGIASAARKDLILSIGHIIQRTRTIGFLSSLKREWDNYADGGRIKNDYTASEQHKDCLQEMLDFLDRDSPDEVRFSFLKRIFLTASTEELSTRDSVLPQQYLRLCRQLSSGEVIVLEAEYKLAQGFDPSVKSSTAHSWLQEIADASGLQYRELVEIHEAGLLDKKLLFTRSYPDRSGVRFGKHRRLTDLAWDICKFLQNYDDTRDV